jgi:DNA-binding MarR family transcriptional regulator
MALKRKGTEQFQLDSLPGIFRLIEQIEKKLDQMKRQTTRIDGLTPSQFAVLSMLWEKDGLPFKDLATANWCTRPTMTGIVDILEKKGLVIRRPNPNDRRSLLVCLTDNGRALQKTTRAMNATFSNCCDGLTTAETKQLSALLHKLDASLS